MARIAGVDLPRDKRVEIGLTYIYGIGRKSATEILAATGVNPDTRVRDLSEDDVSKLRDYIDKNCHVEGDLRRDVAFDIKRPAALKPRQGAAALHPPVRQGNHNRLRLLQPEPFHQALSGAHGLHPGGVPKGE